MEKVDTTLRRVQIRDILRRHRGSIVAVAGEIGRSHVSVTRWLDGKITSANVEAACRAKALELLAQEEQEDAA